MYRVTYGRITQRFATIQEALAYAQGVTSFSASMGRGNAGRSALVTGPYLRIRVRAAGE